MKTDIQQALEELKALDRYGSNNYQIITDSFADREYIRVKDLKKSYESDLLVLPDGLELLCDDASILDKWTNHEFEGTGKKSEMGEVFEIEINGKLFAHKNDPRYSNTNSFKEIENYDKLFRYLKDLNLLDKARLPKIYFAEYQKILLESLFNFSNLAELNNSSIEKKYEELIGNKLKISPCHVFITKNNPENPEFVLVDPDYMAKGK